jgi:hypothetical protein
MTMPPQGGWLPPQQPGSMPPNQGGPYQGSPGSGPQQPHMGQQPPGYPQAPWPQQGVPPQKGNNLKWLLVAIAVLLVIGVTIGATLLFPRGDGDTPPVPSTSAAPGDIASANDNGPVAVITEEPTCKTFNGINNSLAATQAKGWGDQRGTLGPATEWTPDQRTQVDEVATAMRNAADKVETLAKQTPHRVVRELYEQFIAFGRGYADSVATYIPSDNALATVNVSATSALIGICNTIEYTAANRSLNVGSVQSPTGVKPLEDLANPARFVTTSNQTCTEWIQRAARFHDATSEWRSLDPDSPASQWTPERRAIEQAVQPIMTSYANDMEDAGRHSGNPVFEDFAVMAALYLREYVAIGDSYITGDGWLNYTAFRLANVISGACSAVAR